MEQLAKIELAGRVGMVNETIIGNERNVCFNVAVDTMYKGRAGAVASTTWFSCNYWGNIEIERGQEIHLDGRMIGKTYTDIEGKNRQYLEVKVNKIW